MVALLLILGATGVVQARDVVMCTVPWAPFYGPKLEREGFITALSKAAFAASGHEARVEFMPWARAMLEVEQGDRQVLMGAYYTDERAETYIATDRLYTTRVGLVALDELGVERYSSLRELRSYTIGYGRGWATTEEFDNADYLDKEPEKNNVLNVRKLYAGRIDMIAMNFERFLKIAEDEGFDPGRAVFLQPALKESGLYLMISREAEQAEQLAADFNEGLAAIRENGTYDRILADLGIRRE